MKKIIFRIVLIVFIGAFGLLPAGTAAAANTHAGAGNLGNPAPADKSAQEPADSGFPGKKVIPILNVDLLGSYSKIPGGNKVNGGVVDILFAPVLRIDAGHHLIPLYNFNYNRQQQIVAQEEGGYAVQQTLSHNTYLTNKLKLNDRLTTKISGLGTWTYYKESKDEGWSKGLYNYTDIGGIVDFEYEIGSLRNNILDEAGLSLQYYRRNYPNFKSLISLASPTAPETDEKDYDGYRLTFKYLRNNPYGLSVEAAYRPLWKRYTDKLIVGSDGVLISGDKRRDNQHEFNFNLRYPATERLSLYLDNEIVINRSNQNFYDFRGTLVLADDVFIGKYFNYTSYMLKPRVSYDLPLGEQKDLTLQLSYSYLDKQYAHRKAQSATGLYTAEAQEDKFHTFSFGLSYPLTKKIKAITLFNYTIAKSNMKYMQYYK